MATSIGKTHCITCGKERVVYKCGGCSQDFCFDHLTDHRQILGKQLDELEYKRNIFRENLTEQITNPQKELFIHQINKWEEDSIKIIQQTANETRQLLRKYINENIGEIENKLTQLTEQLKQTRQENDFNETHLNRFRQKLNQLEKQLLNRPSNVSIEQDSSSFINKIYVVVSAEELSFPNININTKWMENGITIAGIYGQGNKLNQLNCPYGIFIDDDQTIYIADSYNHRILQWKSNATYGQIVAGGNGNGSQMNQLSYPSDVIIDKENNSLIISDSDNRRVMRWSLENHTENGQIIINDIDCSRLIIDKNGSIYVSDWKKNEVRQWKREDQYGTIVAGGNGKGNNLNQLNTPTSIFIDEDYSLYISDTGNHRVMKWLKDTKEGIIIAGGNDQGNSLTQLSDPRGVIVDQLGQIYVADSGNNRVMRWCKGIKEGTIVVGGNGRGQQSNQLYGPRSLFFDRQGNLYVADRENHRIQKFEIN